MPISEKWDEDDFTLINSGKGKSFNEIDEAESQEELTL
jgi:hypothetical protein